MIPYFLKRRKVLAKLTSKNQLTLPKSVTQALGPVQYFEVQSKAGQIILTPVRIQRGDALRAKLAELKIDAKTIESAVAWAEPAPAKKSSKAVAAKKPVAKPLSRSSVLGRRIETTATADLKESLSRVFAQASKR
jgi:enoyl-CoA hydratase/carnithine racemase